MSFSWGGSAGVLEAPIRDPGDFVPAPVTVQERDFVAGVIAEQDAGVVPCEDPAQVAYWELLADVEETLAAEAAAGEESAGLASEELVRGLSVAAQGLDRAWSGESGLVGVFDPTLVEGLEAVGRVRSRVDALLVGLAVEADRRGLPAAVGMGLVDWVKVRCPWLSTAEAAQLRQVVAAAGQHWGAPLVEAVLEGRSGLARAARVAATLRRLAPGLDVDRREAYAGIATGAACDPEINDRDLGRVCAKLLADLLEEEPADEERRAATELRCVSRRRVGAGLVRYTLDAPDVDAALIDGVLNGPLAAPDPGHAGTDRHDIDDTDDADGQTRHTVGDEEQDDLRSAGQRRYDAVLTVLTRGLGNPGAPATSGRASVIITVTADPDTGQPRGAACPQVGDAVLTAADAGRFACLGDVTPVVLGEAAEPLRLGRTTRLATPGQFKALLVRDDHCTFPGCSVPGSWCEAHHLVWWCRGGRSDLENLVLLCGRHHRVVHAKDLMATVTGGLTSWHV